MKQVYAELCCNKGAKPVFEGLDVTAELRENLATTSIIQTYRNDSDKPIEAVYTFPLSLDAVLLELTVTLGDRTLKGCVVPKASAEKQYEKAIDNGDTPVMLESSQPGLYTLNLGNLLPGERATITLTIGTHLRWQGECLRYLLPTTIAPRYGDPVGSGLAPHQVPETSPLIENRFSFTMTITGELAGDIIESPSHKLVCTRTGEDSCMVTLADCRSSMDRDLIITIRHQGGGATSGILTRDGDEWLLWCALNPRLPVQGTPEPKNVVIVVDCSGSMQGDSIAQARLGLSRIIDELNQADRFNILRFGSTTKPLFRTMLPATPERLDMARELVECLAADLGGTEIEPALAMATAYASKEVKPDILLITDGEVWSGEAIIAKAIKSGCRFFTVGVGSSVSEVFVRTLAERSGGACELVSPNEQMGERIHNHFRRISTPRAEEVRITWPTEPLRVYPATVPVLFDGDTASLYAWFDEPPQGTVSLSMKLTDGTDHVITIPISEMMAAEGEQTIARMAAAVRLANTDDSIAGEGIATHYQLISRWTNYLAILTRNDDEKTGELPTLETVRQMLAAGWGGFGSVVKEPKFSISYDRFTPISQKSANVGKCCCIPRYSVANNDYEGPTSLRKTVGQETRPSTWEQTLERVQNNVIDNDVDQLKKLVLLDLGIHYSPILEDLATDDLPEWRLTLIVIMLMTENDPGVPRNRKRIYRKACRLMGITDSEIKKVRLFLDASSGA